MAEGRKHRRSKSFGDGPRLNIVETSKQVDDQPTGLSGKKKQEQVEHPKEDEGDKGMLKRITPIHMDKELKKRSAKDKGKIAGDKGDVATLKRKKGHAFHIA